jgi:hypothetical protein
MLTTRDRKGICPGTRIPTNTGLRIGTCIKRVGTILEVLAMMHCITKKSEMSVLNLAIPFVPLVIVYGVVDFIILDLWLTNKWANMPWQNGKEE